MKIPEHDACFPPVYRSGRHPACRRAGHLARRIVVRASPSVPRSEVPFRTARCRPLRQPRWLPLQPQASAKHGLRPCRRSLTFVQLEQPGQMSARRSSQRQRSRICLWSGISFCAKWNQEAKTRMKKTVDTNCLAVSIQSNFKPLSHACFTSKSIPIRECRFTGR
jgi:hypothetical protein